MHRTPIHAYLCDHPAEAFHEAQGGGKVRRVQVEMRLTLVLVLATADGASTAEWAKIELLGA